MSQLTYQSAVEFIRTWGTDSQNPPYDFNGVVHLMLAALDNIREHALENELDDIGYSMTDEQRFFLKKIADCACRVSDAKIKAEDD
ncbi:MAG: hypothetical protein R3C53_02820 [Pirellulaceae bacterium]